MSEYTWAQSKKDWNKALVMVASLIPKWVIGEDKPVAKKPPKDTITKIIPLCIAVLSLASITNLSNRAYDHHKSWNSYLVGGGIAVLVPLGIFAALTVERKLFKGLIWVATVIFAVMSAMIQYQVYLPVGSEKIRTDQMWEAIAFGAGVPLAECLLAAMEAMLLTQAGKRKKEEIVEQEAHEKQLALQAIELKRLEDDRDFERRKKEIELENYKLTLTQNAELKRLAVESKLSNKVLKNQKTPVENSTPQVDATGENDVEINKKKAKIQQRQHLIFQHIKTEGDPGATALSEKFKVDRGTIYTDLGVLKDSGLIRKNGDKKYHAIEGEA